MPSDKSVNRFPNCYYFPKRYWQSEFHSRLCRITRKYFHNRLDPLNLCPRTILFWFFIPPYRAIGISILDLQRIAVYGRQQIEPNQTIYLMFKILELNSPIPLTLLIMFASLGLVLTDGANKIVQAVRSEYENIVPTDESVTPSLNPFNLTPRMSIYFPIIDDHTSIGFLTIDLRHIEFSIKQSLEPNENIKSLIRFIDIYAPFPLQIGIMFLSVGLFLCGIIFKFILSLNQELLDEIRCSL
ncbi:MAG TPA: hypothetical protein GX523_16240 [Desulfitobacterium dehalogenans]|uniref:Uncharacterized protein n=1 Tax=Desulfitobacterium dehalogenans TaxID=36854 RepID=A0A7C7D7M7_9FIRM|nr:hypothetical protein [Desulfitobacterium dehalogenans]